MGSSLMIFSKQTYCYNNDFLTGVVLHAVYYACFGHPWVDINGPKVEHDEDERMLIVSYYRQGECLLLQLKILHW